MHGRRLRRRHGRFQSSRKRLPRSMSWARRHLNRSRAIVGHFRNRSDNPGSVWPNCERWLERPATIVASPPRSIGSPKKRAASCDPPFAWQVRSNGCWHWPRAPSADSADLPRSGLTTVLAAIRTRRRLDLAFSSLCREMSDRTFLCAGLPSAFVGPILTNATSAVGSVRSLPHSLPARTSCPSSDQQV